MSYRLVVRPEVDADLLEAEKFYDIRQEGLGQKFLRATRQTMARLPRNPLLYRVRHRRKQVRWAYPRRFPYRIIFRVMGDTVVIYAVIHAARMTASGENGCEQIGGFGKIPVTKPDRDGGP